MPHPTPIGTGHEIFALVCEGMRQGDIVARVGVAQKTVNHILLKQAVTASLEPRKSTGAPRKITTCQERALFRMVRKDSIKSACTLTERMRNLYGVLVGCETINNHLAARGYHAHRIQRKPLLTANHRRLLLEWAEVTELDCSWFSAIPHPDGHMKVHRLPVECFQEDCQPARVLAGGGSVNVCVGGGGGGGGYTPQGCQITPCAPG